MLPEIRALVAGTDVALIDATEDDAQAVDAFSQAAGQLGVKATAMYSECMHDGLEVFVRSHGAFMLMGPLEEAEWDEWIEHALQGGRQRGLRKAA